MKVLSFNVRGAESSVKRKEVLIRANNIDICCLQETKLEVVNWEYYRMLWGNDSFGWAARESEGRSGGVIQF